MANVAHVQIEASVPFDWATRLDANELSMFASLAFCPVYGLDFEFEEIGYVPNEHGGRTSMWKLRIEGEEAIWLSTIRAWMEAIERVGGEVHLCTHTDLEWDRENVQTTVLARQVV